MINKTLRAALLLAVSFGPLGAHSALAETTLTAVMSAPLKTTDPQVSTARINITYAFLVFDTLLGLDADLKVQPQMASWKVSDDGLTYTFTLRDGLKWHDGKPVLAEDCVASLKRWGENDGAGGKLMQRVSALTATSDNTFTLTLSEPFGQVLDLLAKPAPIPAFMVPKRLAETPKGQQMAEVIGSGPFRFVGSEFQPGVRAVFEKNIDYVPRSEPASGSAGGKVVNVDRVVWEVMPDVQTAINALQSGDIDLLERLPNDLAPLVQANDDVKVGVLKQVGTQLTGQFNHLIPPFDNVKVRQAALYAMDQEQQMQTSVGDPTYYKLCASIYGCDVPMASDAGSEYLSGTAQERMAKAKELLKASGYKGEKVVMLQPTDNSALMTQPIVAAEQLREAGFNVEVDSMDWATLSSRRTSREPIDKGGWNMFFTSWGVEGIWNPLSSVLIDGTGNPGAWSGWRKSDRVEQLRDNWIKATTPEKQKEIASEIQQLAWDEGFYFNGGEFQSLSAWSAKVDGFVLGMNTQFWGVHK